MATAVGSPLAKARFRAGSFSHAAEPREAGLGWRQAPDASTKQLHQSVVGASRRRAAPGSQAMDLEALPRLGQFPIHRGILGGVMLAPMSVLEHRPNPSIEGTSNSQLRCLSAAPHVKR
jgi:hypothetical protein